MPDRNQVENILDNLSKLAQDSSNTNSSFFEPTQPVIGRQMSVHNTLGGGTSADVLLWRNKKVSASVLSSATAVWILFEWLNYNFLTLLSFVLIIGMLAQFMWSNASGYFTSGAARSQVPRLVLPDELFIKIAISVGKEANKGLGYLQDISCSGNLKQLILVIGSLLAASLIGTWCNFLTVIYIGFVAAHTLPVLYEKYEDEFDRFISQAFRQIESNYRKLDAGVLQRLPTRNLRRQKYQVTLRRHCYCVFSLNRVANRHRVRIVLGSRVCARHVGNGKRMYEDV